MQYNSYNIPIYADFLFSLRDFKGSFTIFYLLFYDIISDCIKNHLPNILGTIGIFGEKTQVEYPIQFVTNLAMNNSLPCLIFLH